MSRTVDVDLHYEHHTDWAFLQLADETLPYRVLDAAEFELRGRDDLETLIDAAEPQGDGTSQLDLGTVTVTDDGRFDELTVTADTDEPAAKVDA